MAKLVDALDLGSSAAMCESSSLSGPISSKRPLHEVFFRMPNGETPITPPRFAQFRIPTRKALRFVNGLASPGPLNIWDVALCRAK